MSTCRALPQVQPQADQVQPQAAGLVRLPSPAKKPPPPPLPWEPPPPVQDAPPPPAKKPPPPLPAKDPAPPPPAKKPPPADFLALFTGCNSRPPPPPPTPTPPSSSSSSSSSCSSLLPLLLLLLPPTTKLYFVHVAQEFFSVAPQWDGGHGALASASHRRTTSSHRRTQWGAFTRTRGAPTGRSQERSGGILGLSDD